MLETRDVGRRVGALDVTVPEITRIDPAETFCVDADAPVPAEALEPQLACGSTRAAAVAELRARFAGYRTAEPNALARVCVAAAYASALGVPYWMAHSQRDYASAILGVKHPTFCRWVKVGRVLCAIPKLRDDLREGRVTLSELEQLASASAASAKEKQTATPAPHFVTMSIAAPAPAILYLEDSLQLARGFVGATDGDEDAANALLAEAATECEDRVDVAVARRRFHVRENGSQRGGETQQRPPTQTSKISTLPSQQVPPSLPQLTLRTMSETARREAAFRVHSILVRLLKRRDRLQVRQEDQLYEWMLDRIHERSGFRRFERFAQEVLDLPYGTFRERLRHARLRRLENPIALARRDGEITAVQAELLDHLYRACEVPTSDLPGWIHYAAAHTARRLRAALRWAKREIDIDYRRWSLAHCAPPDEDQFRTTDHSLESLVRHSGTDTLVDALITWETAPRGTLRLCLTRETRDELLVQMASMQDELRGGAARRVPAWLALCRVFHRAREAWRVHYQAPPAALRRVLDRDGYQCAAPECTQRKNLQVHHVRYRSQGGGDADANRVTLCAFHHHHGEHGGRLRVRGQLDALGRGLIWEMGLDVNGRAQRIYRDERLLSAAPH